MFRDNSLMPKEAIRLSAFGLLSRGPKSYAAPANGLRHFITRFWGPTLDVMASSIELTRLENLIEGTGEDGGGTAGDFITAPHRRRSGQAQQTARLPCVRKRVISAGSHRPEAAVYASTVDS